MLNVVALMGRMTKDPELRHTPQGTPVCAFTVAVDRYSKGSEKQADFLDCVAWRNTAEFICQYFQKGKMIGISGSIQTRTYQDKNGNNRKAVEIVVGNASFAGGKGDGESNKNTYSAPSYAAPSNSAPPDCSVIDDDGEDLPF